MTTNWLIVGRALKRWGLALNTLSDGEDNLVETSRQGEQVKPDDLNSEILEQSDELEQLDQVAKETPPQLSLQPSDGTQPEKGAHPNVLAQDMLFR